jgi:hypothetical protein
MDPLNNMSYLIPFGSITFIYFHIHHILYPSFIKMQSVTFFIHVYHPSLLAFSTFLLVVYQLPIILSMSISAHIYIHIHTSNPKSIHPNWKKGSVVYSAHILTHSIFTYTFTFISIYIYYDIL